jgi:uncharacterized protein (TIGR03083 family)
MDVWECIDAERAELADLCDTLTPEQWDMPSLCDAWRVRDVVAHVTETATLTTGAAVIAVARSGFRIGTMLEREAIKAGAAPTEELTAGLRATVGTRRTPPGVKPPGVLADAVVHQQDIRRVVDAPRVIDEQRLRFALDEMKDAKVSLLPGKQRRAGLHLVATDLAWSAGAADDPEARGTGEALLLAMAGRPAAMGDLEGPGVATLRSRL